MERLSLAAAALALMAANAWASDDGFAIAHAVESAAVAGAALAPAAPAGANAVAGSFGGASQPLNILQNSGAGVVQNAQNVLAETAPCGCAGPARAEATGTQLARVSLSGARIERSAGASNTIRDSFAGSSGMVNVVQNTGSNVAQNAENVLALVLRRP